MYSCIGKSGLKTIRTMSLTTKLLAVIACVGVLMELCAAFYLPGLAPVNYCPLDKQEENCKVMIFSMGGVVRRYRYRQRDRYGYGTWL